MQQEYRNTELQQPSKQKWSFYLGQAQTYCFATLVKLPFTSKLLQHTFLGAIQYIKWLARNNSPDIALQYAILLLKSKKYKEGPKYRWWHIMRQAVMLVQDNNLDKKQSYSNDIKQLVDLGENGPLCPKGIDVAFCFVGFGLWAFRAGKTNLAIKYINYAIEADNSWGYPDYLMGRLGLNLKDIDSVQHFVNAVKYNWSFFHRINRDPVCQKYPELLKEVRKKYQDKSGYLN